MTCKTCKHYVPSEKEKDQGFCRRFPPQAAAPNYFQFPGVKAEFVCGEHTKKPGKK